MSVIRRALLTNDDGIDAPGLAVLERIAASLCDAVWVVAPAHDQSGTGQSVSLHNPIRVAQRGERRFAVTGTPNDCVVLGLHLMGEMAPDLVLSGVNRGANLADEVAYSGTAGAAMTGTLLGVRSIALSQAYRDPTNVRWDAAQGWGPAIVRALHDDPWPAGITFNVNFPDADPDQIDGCMVSRQGSGSVRSINVEPRRDRRDQSYFWIGFSRHASEAGFPPDADVGPDTDVGALRARRIAITPLRSDRSDARRFNDLQARLTGLRPA